MTTTSPRIEEREVNKCCTGCGETKPLGEFYRDKRRNGYRAACKKCCNADNAAWRRENPERAAEHTRRYREQHAERTAETAKRWWENNPERRRQYDEGRYRRDYEKASARRILRDAVFRGRLLKPDCCEDCGFTVQSASDLHGHHPDYSKPLEVEWLCRGCHAKRHRRAAR